MKSLSNVINSILATRNLKIVRGGYTKYGIEKSNLVKNKSRTFIKDLNLDIETNSHDFLLRNYKLLKDLLLLTLAKITIEKDGKVLLIIQGLNFEIQTSEDILILHEIFIQGIYNIQTSENFIFIDIGMNVGFTSLFFAAKDQVEKIYSFEPFIPTFYQGLKNFDLNKEGVKIIPSNYGLGSTEEKIEVDYIPSLRGSMGINGIPFYIKSNNDSIRKEIINIKPVDKVFKKILFEHPNKAFVFKIDCEGSEYAILECLSTNNMLQFINAFLIEWHLKGPNELVNTLRGENFKVLSFSPHNKETGLIYAFK